MKLKQITFERVRRLQAFTPVLVVGVLMLTGAVIYNFNAHAATAGFYFDSSATTYKVGDTITLGVYEDSGTQCANVVQADFTYPANMLRYNSASSTGSKFNASVQSQSGNGSVSLVQYTTDKGCGTGASATSGYSGDQFIGNVSFTVIQPGTAVMAFKSSATAVSSADNKTNVAPSTTTRTLTLTNASPVPIPTPTPTPAPQPTPAPAPRPAPAPTPSSVRPRPQPVPVTGYTPPNTDTAIPATNNETIEIQTPVDINPLPIQPDGINKIEYYLNGKLVSTVRTAPYTYHLATEKLLNGKYTFTTKTFYLNGQTKSVSQTLIVKNPFSWTQLKLRLQQLAWLIILLVLLVVAAIAAWIFHRKNNGDDDYFDDGTYDDGQPYSDNSGTIISPSNSSEAPQTVQPYSQAPTPPATYPESVPRWQQRL